MYPQEIALALSTIFKQEARSIVIFLQGPPGIGKTACVGQAVRSANKKLVTFALPTCESVDLRGLPFTEKGAYTMGLTFCRVMDRASSIAR